MSPRFAMAMAMEPSPLENSDVRACFRRGTSYPSELPAKSLMLSYPHMHSAPMATPRRRTCARAYDGCSYGYGYVHCGPGPAPRPPSRSPPGLCCGIEPAVAAGEVSTRPDRIKVFRLFSSNSFRQPQPVPVLGSTDLASTRESRIETNRPTRGGPGHSAGPQAVFWTLCMHVYEYAMHAYL
ncbi:hypothetical protein GY45DRAFT_607457 [Cubamyces sp. BRFM 1775]|nr:hypothetical protein GY45DRAFT_607457 [Cubamyces sp. BRFM 1775]